MVPRAALLLVGVLVTLLPTLSDANTVQCQRNSECHASLACRSGRCVIECRENRDCEPGSFCVSPDQTTWGICVEREAIAPDWFPELLRDTVLWGGDLADMPLRRSEPLDCHVACVAKTNCAAWSFAPAGMAGRPIPWCYLKGAGFAARSNPGSVSGITRQPVHVQQ